ncbi:uncharacterized protein ELE39_003499 [Cryptosporidium sp. chipmunk genotype I]|uniref:uncharacterized protein n=1 Tax=Cryptosporidium sp. chipmunk genotype I TaxID=1280935 RepID=UPI00351A84CA|nr:hypothetical protein ELE39_003499 [Cryptosporidium sp. chipmunk genotype I]
MVNVNSPRKDLSVLAQCMNPVEEEIQEEQVFHPDSVILPPVSAVPFDYYPYSPRYKYPEVTCSYPFVSSPPYVVHYMSNLGVPSFFQQLDISIEQRRNVFQRNSGRNRGLQLEKGEENFGKYWSEAQPSRPLGCMG